MKEELLLALTGHGVAPPAILFAIVGALVFVVASRLAHYADVIAEATGLGRLWVGSLLLAGSTSLPEIVTDTDAALFGLPDIGVGDLFGSTLANMLILALLIIVYERRRLLQQAAIDHALVGAVATVLTALAGLSIASGGFGSIGAVGADTLVIGAIYVMAMRVVFDLTRRPTTVTEAVSPDEAELPPRSRVRNALLSFAAATVGLMLVLPFLVVSAQALAIESRTDNSFVGTFLVGVTTSFPELAAAIAAVRLGAVDLAVGNIFGSNAFNMTVLLFMDVAYRSGPVLASVSHAHVISAFVGVIALSLGVMALLARTHERVWVARSIAALIVLVYAAGMYAMARAA